MIYSQLVLIPVLLVFVWGYLSLRPATHRRKTMMLFDTVVIACAIVLSVATGLWIASLLRGGSTIWETVMSTVSTFHVFPAVLLIGWYVRRRIFS